MCAGPLVAELGRQDLHVPGEHHEVDVVRRQAPRCTAASCAALSPSTTGRWCELDAEPLGRVGVIGVVADHDRDVDRRARPRATGAAGRTRQCGSSRPARRPRARSSENRSRHRMANRSATGAKRRRISSRARSKPSSSNSTRWKNALVGVVGVLLQVDDVAAVLGDERGRRGHDAGPVGTGRQQPCGRLGSHLASVPRPDRPDRAGGGRRGRYFAVQPPSTTIVCPVV